MEKQLHRSYTPTTFFRDALIPLIAFALALFVMRLIILMSQEHLFVRAQDIEPTVTISITPTDPPLPTPSDTPIDTPTPIETPFPTIPVTPSPSPSPEPTITDTPSVTVTPGATITVTPTIIPRPQRTPETVQGPITRAFRNIPPPVILPQLFTGFTQTLSVFDRIGKYISSYNPLYLYGLALLFFAGGIALLSPDIIESHFYRDIFNIRTSKKKVVKTSPVQQHQKV